MYENINPLTTASIDGGKIIQKFDQNRNKARTDCLKRPQIQKAQHVIIFSLNDFIEHLKSDRCKNNKGAIFVEETQAIADLAYRIHQIQRVIFPLAKSAEYAALLKLTRGVSQKELWKLLGAGLDGCLPESLWAAIRMIHVSSKTEGRCEIQPTGESNSRSNGGLKVAFQPRKGAKFKETAIPLDWEWKGRIWECFDRICTIQLRLEIHTDAGLRFTFNPCQLTKTLIEQRAYLVKYLQEEIGKRFQVYQGKFPYEALS